MLAYLHMSEIDPFGSSEEHASASSLDEELQGLLDDAINEVATYPHRAYDQQQFMMEAAEVRTYVNEVWNIGEAERPDEEIDETIGDEAEQYLEATLATTYIEAAFRAQSQSMATNGLKKYLVSEANTSEKQQDITLDSGPSSEPRDPDNGAD